MKKIAVFLFLLLLMLPIRLHAQTSNAGFVPGNIWYSQDPFEEGDKLKIYTVIFNPDQKELLGTVIFFDNTVFLGKKDFNIPAQGVKDVWITWTATVGDHVIFGKIENSRFLISADKYQDVYLTPNQTEQSKRTVNKKIILPSSSENTNIISNIENTGSESIQNIKKLVAANTPDLVTKPIIKIADTIEQFRSNIATASKDKKEKIKNEIKLLDQTEKSSKNTTKTAETNKFLKPFKYVELLALSVASGTFDNKFIFYGISLIFLYFLIRYLWRLIF